MQYVEAGTGVGVVPESTSSKHLVLIPLKPQQSIPLVMVWAKEGDDPAVLAFRDLVKEWLRKGELWG